VRIAVTFQIGAQQRVTAISVGSQRRVAGGNLVGVTGRQDHKLAARPLVETQQSHVFQRRLPDSDDVAIERAVDITRRHFFTAIAGRILPSRLNIRAGLITVFFAVAAIACSTNPSDADEGGVGFWFPGLFGSLAAEPQVPGWALGIVDLYNPVSAG